MNVDTRQLKALVLNANYMPVDVFPLMAIPCIPAALTRCYQSKPTCVVHYDWPVPVRSTRSTWEYNYPSVIVRLNTNFYHRQGVQLNHETLFYRDKGVCAYCNEHTPIYQNRQRYGTKDHVWPISRGGANDWDNVVWSCAKCNQAKDSAEPKGKWRPNWKGWTPTYWQLLKNRKEFPLRVQDKRWLEFLPEWQGEVIETMELNV